MATRTRKPKEDKPILAECGNTGLKESGGRILEEFDPNLKGEKFKRVIREMLANETYLAAPYFLIEVLLRNTPRTFKLNDSGHPESARCQEFVDQCWNDMESTPQEVLTNAATALPWGYSVMETTYKIRRGMNAEPRLNSAHDDGLYGWRDFAPRSQDSLHEWAFSDEGRLLGMVQQVDNKSGTFFVPTDRMLHIKFRGSKHNPQGFSAFRPAWPPYYYAKRHREIEGIVVERVGAGIPVIRVPVELMDPKATPAQKATRAKWEELAKKIRIDAVGGVVIPGKLNSSGKETGFDIELMAAAGRSAVDSDPIIKRYEVGMLTALLSQFLSFGTQQVGSFALSSDMTSQLGFAIGAFNSVIDQEINRHAIPQLLTLNGFPRECWPTMESADVETPKLAEAGAFLSAMVSSGAMQVDDEIENWTRKQIGLEPREGISTDDMLGAAMGDEAPTEAETEEGAQLALPLAEAAPPPDMMTLEEASEELRIPVGSLRRAIRNGKLKGIQVGRNVRVRRADIEEAFGG